MRVNTNNRAYYIKNKMEFRLSKKTKRKLKEYAKSTLATLKETGKEVGSGLWEGTKATAKHIYTQSPKYARGFREAATISQEAFAPMPKPQPMIMPRRPRPRYPMRGGYIDFRTPLKRRNPFENI